MSKRPTQKTGNREVSSLTNLEGVQPVDPKGAEVLPQGNNPNEKGLIISTPGGTVVRATHPGRVSKIEKQADSTIVVEVVATKSVLNLQTRRDAPFTRYSGLGNTEVALGQVIGAGQQIGAVAFISNREAGGGTGLKYQVFANGSGTKASERFPSSEEGKSIIRKAQPDGQVPNPEIRSKEAPPEAADGDAPLNPRAGDQATLDNVGPTNAPYVTRPQVKFLEQKNQVFSHDFLVFINGVDVTQYVTGTLSINLVDRDGWNEANLTLNNASNNFVITLENIGINGDLKGKFRTQDIPGEEKYSERAKKQIIEYKNDQGRNPFVDVSTMGLIQAGTTTGVENVAPLGRQEELASQQPNSVSDSAIATRRDRGRDKATTSSDGAVDRRWQLGFQSTVFHKHDPIRIFRKNPIRETNEWMPAFAGYLNQISYDTNYVNGLSTVKISCYDIRALAQKMRVQTTAITGITNPRAIFRGREEAGSQSLFTDLLDPTIVGSPLAGKRFEDVMEFLITGSTTSDSNINDAFGESKFKRGIGDFTVGDKIFHSPGDSDAGISPDPLEHWHALCLFGMDGQTVRRGDQTVNVTGGSAKRTLNAEMNRRWLTRDEAVNIGKNTTHDGVWSPHKQFVHLLLPAAGTGAKNLIDFDAANVNSNQLDFRSRLDIMQDFCNRIDYQFWVTPIGDIVIEFPMYDFLPEDYQEYKTVFQVDKHLRSDNIQDEAGEMVTAIIANGRIRAERDANVGAAQFQPKAVVVSPMMMMRYGVIEHDLTLPFITNPDSLARIAQIEFQKKLAESNKMEIEFDYRPFILPNRPIEHMERKRMGLTTAVRNDLIVFKSGSTSITTRYVRRQTFRRDGSVAYTFIFSGSSMPISYREIYEPGTINPVSAPAAGGVNLRVNSLTADLESNSAAPVTDPVITQATIETASITKQIGSAAASPTPPLEQVGRFMALAQVSSGWNPANRGEDGSFGLFGLSKGLRDFSNIGDTTDITSQVNVANDYFRGLVSKYKGDLNMAVAEFKLGAEKVRNADIVAEFQRGTGAVIKELGKKYEEIAQPLVDGFDKLFPGEKEPQNLINENLGEAARAELKAVEEAGPLPSSAGFQNNVGILVFDNREKQARRSTEASAQQVQASQNLLRRSGNNG